MLFDSQPPHKTQERLSTFKIRNVRSSISRVSEQADLNYIQNINQQQQYVNLLVHNTKASPIIYKTLFITYILLSLALLIIGIILIVIGSQILTPENHLYLQIQYYSPNNQSLCNIDQTCSFQFEITQEILSNIENQNIYVSYLVDGWLQNQNSSQYFYSVNRKQLAGIDVSQGQLIDDCGNGFLTNSQMGKTKSFTGKDLVPQQIANPCGQIAFNLNNDTFALFQHDSNNLIQITNNLWQGYKQIMFLDNQNTIDKQWISHQQPQFISWMSFRGFPRKKIILGSLNQQLLPGNYTINATLNYKSDLWTGDRYLYIESQRILSGRILIFPIMLIVVGLIGFFSSFFIRMKWIKIVKNQQQ